MSINLRTWEVSVASESESDAITMGGSELLLGLWCVIRVQVMSETQANVTTVAAGIVGRDFCFFPKLQLMAFCHWSLGKVSSDGGVAAASSVEVDDVGSCSSHLILPQLLLWLPEPGLW